MKLEPQVSKHTKFLLTKAQGFLFCAVTVMTFVCFYTVSDIFSIKSIRIEGTSEVRGIEDYFGRSTLLLSTSDIEGELRKNNPKLSHVVAAKVFPSTLTILVTTKRPSVVLKLADGYITLAADGYIIQKSKEISDLKVPLISYYQPLFYSHYGIGELFDNDDIQTVTHVTRNLVDIGLEVSSIDIASENMLVLHTDAFDVFMTSEKDADQQFAEFEYTYKELKIDGRKFSSIDVRFEKPIVKLL